LDSYSTGKADPERLCKAIALGLLGAGIEKKEKQNFDLFMAREDLLLARPSNAVGWQKEVCVAVSWVLCPIDCRVVTGISARICDFRWEVGILCDDSKLANGWKMFGRHLYTHQLNVFEKSMRKLQDSLIKKIVQGCSFDDGIAETIASFYGNLKWTPKFHGIMMDCNEPLLQIICKALTTEGYGSWHCDGLLFHFSEEADGNKFMALLLAEMLHCMHEYRLSRMDKKILLTEGSPRYTLIFAHAICES
jgi:hypothetical protein